MPDPTDPPPKDVALTPVLVLLRGTARRTAESADSAYAIADLLAADPAASADHTRRGDELWRHAGELRAKGNELRLLAGSPDTTAQQRIDAVTSAHELMGTIR